MDKHDRLDLFNSAHENAIFNIKKYLNKEPHEYDYEMSHIVNFMLNSDHNPYLYLQGGFEHLVQTSTGFSSLINEIKHALYDDGDIEFVTVFDQPRIIFADKNSLNFYNRILKISEEKQLRRQGKDIKDVVRILPKDAKNFAILCQQVHESNLKRCYVNDAARHSVKFANEHYSSYSCWSDEWENELSEKIREREKLFNRTFKDYDIR